MALFGLNLSRNVYRDIQNSTTRIVTKITNNFQQTNSARITNKQRIDVNINDADINCFPGSFKVTNNVDTSIQSLSNFKAQFDQEINNKVTEQLSTEIEKIIKQKNKGINFGQFNLGSEVTEAIKNSTVEITNDIVNAFDQKIASGQENNQILNINISGSKIRGADCNFTNTALLRIVNQVTGSAVANTLSSNESFKQLLSRYKLTIDQSNTGFDLAGIFTTIAIIIGIIAIVIVIVAVIGLIFSAKLSKKALKPI